MLKKIVLKTHFEWRINLASWVYGSFRKTEKFGTETGSICPQGHLFWEKAKAVFTMKKHAHCSGDYRLLEEFTVDQWRACSLAVPLHDCPSLPGQTGSFLSPWGLLMGLARAGHEMRADSGGWGWVVRPFPEGYGLGATFPLISFCLAFFNSTGQGIGVGVTPSNLPDGLGALSVLPHTSPISLPSQGRWDRRETELYTKWVDQTPQIQSHFCWCSDDTSLFMLHRIWKQGPGLWLAWWEEDKSPADALWPGPGKWTDLHSGTPPSASSRGNLRAPM